MNAPDTHTNCMPHRESSFELNPTEPRGWFTDARWMALVAFVLRLVYIVWRRTYLFDPTNGHFAFGMETGSIARSIASGEGFASPFQGSTGPTAWIAPLYPYMCAAVFKLLGIFSNASSLAILATDSLFSAVTCFPMMKIGRRTVGTGAAAIAGWTWAIAPQFMKWPAEWVWETSLSALFVAIVFERSLALADESTRRRWAWFGVLWGVIALTNPALLTLLPWSVAWIAIKRRQHGDAWRQLTAGAAISVAICVLMMSPWMLRNRLVLGQWVFVRDNFGFELHLGNYPTSFGMGWGGLHPTSNPREYQLYKEIGELRYIAAKGAEARHFIERQPGMFAQLCWIRFQSFWSGSSLRYSRNSGPWTVPEFFAVTLLALFGFLWALRERVCAMGLFCWIVIYPAPYYITYPQARYRHPVEPMMLLLAGFFVVQMVLWVRSKREPRSGSQPQRL